ncbi:hypothetical protein ACFZAR_05555 [Streptomyces sp. NPDC008222]|uniref:hypothetical protein n=1 Tax=Streptomyces sp. NPDC008222 TaxID=3364820 RepID=UPI0036E7191F
MRATLKIETMTIDGHPYGCPECGSASFTLDGSGLYDGAPAWGNCWDGHSWPDPLITLGVLRQINEARSGRERAEDDDTFEVEVGGAVLAGILHPEVTADDLKRAGRVYWQKLVKPVIRKQKRRAIGAVKRPVRNAVASTKAAAIGAAWGIQAGGTEPDPDYEPEPVIKCAACNGKGHHAIESRLHKTTTVRCSVCYGTGEID